MKVNKNLPTPLYHQVKDYLEEKIILGEWEPGYQLPTEKELALQFNVSTITIKRAVHDLVNKGILFRQRGKGTFVNKKGETDLQQLVSLRNEAEDATHHPHKLLSFQEDDAGGKIAKHLEISSRDKVYKIHRIKIEGDTPFGIEYSYIPSSPFPGLTHDMIEDDLIYNVFTNKYGKNLGKAKIFFSTILADEYEARLLKIPKGEQLFVLERYTFTEDQMIIEYSRFIILQEKTRYFIEIKL
ncbi:GntR family transcriptional regulator [Fictibacillus solisalsi]|uniref:GntR family transcriptional regulator n=1 Tax=Fictibacillus solisalsi TaxID=459525 RepID=A0A1G9V2C2_9BACL|nr:GntR family transcriptional regulator [Fictibacillus solisalsi]SDM66268.1 GntR family transcriptional regulator [Fictibacillus solisalsi]